MKKISAAELWRPTTYSLLYLPGKTNAKTRRWKEQKKEEARPKLEEALDHTLASSMYSSLNYLAHISLFWTGMLYWSRPLGDYILIPLFVKIIDGKSKNEKGPILSLESFCVFYPCFYF